MSESRYAVRTYGCQMNEHDSERIAGLLEQDGYVETDEVSDADVIVLNTCCIRENADNKLYGQLGHLKRVKDDRRRDGGDLKIVVSGCLSQKDGDLVRKKAPWVDVVLGTFNVHRTGDLLRHAAEHGPITEILSEAVVDDQVMFPSALPARRELPYAGWVTIQIGCDNTCAFCIVPSVRGPEISRPFDSIVAEVTELARTGAIEVTLLGQNVNSYGRDLALAQRRAGDESVAVRPMFADLLRAVGSVPGIQRVRYTSPHPKDLRPETIAAMREVPTVCEHLHLPLQSGSDRVLSAMHRGYTGARYLDRLALARAEIDDLAVSTDIIVGFPGETDQDFADTLAVAAEAQYDSAYTFIYSPRPGTEAAELVDQFVPADVVADRFERLRVVVERSGLARYQARVGRTEEIVIEGPSKKDASVLSGRTRQNKLVHVATAQPLRPGTLATATITRAAPHHLIGELVDIVSVPKRASTRIPVAAG
jgi:tRNA-2-methylthio-N6-dimethylallyladenosine synthase